MKMMDEIKLLLSIFIPIIWFLVYVGGGSFGIAYIAAHNLNHVAWYMPVLIPVWIVGFFVGNILLRWVYNKLF
jgi:hypothetical protein